MSKRKLAHLATAMSLLLAAVGANAHSPEQHSGHDAHAGHAAAKAPDGATVRLTDVPLTNQLGAAVRLKSDVVADKIVVMDFVYTTCTTVCPVVSAIMGQVQTQLGDRVGRDVELVSITVDPVRDTPSRLREYAKKHGAGAGWTWLTGATADMDETLKGLGTYTPDFEDHPVVMMVGDGRSGKWTRFYGFADPAALVGKVEELTATRATAGGAHHAHSKE